MLPPSSLPRFPGTAQAATWWSPANDPWITPSERDQLRTTPRYDETVAYLRRLVTDGADYQYDVTFGWNGPAGHSPSIGNWLDNTYRGPVDEGLQ